VFAGDQVEKFIWYVGVMPNFGAKAVDHSGGAEGAEGGAHRRGGE
jgi:hypothetical protein